MIGVTNCSGVYPIASMNGRKSILSPKTYMHRGSVYKQSPYSELRWRFMENLAMEKSRWENDKRISLKMGKGDSEGHMLT